MANEKKILRRGVATAGALVALAMLGGCEGPAGPAGPAGATGEQGIPGQNGQNGTDGNNGTDGTDGTDGRDGSNGSDGQNGATGPEGQPGSGKWLSFADVGFPTTVAEKHQARASKSINLNGTEHAIAYNVILRSGQDPSRTDKSCDFAAHPESCFGVLMDKNYRPLLDGAGVPMVANSNDYSSLLPKGNALYAVNAFESNPAGLFVTKVLQNRDTGALQAAWTKAIDLSGVDGVWTSCAGSVTPWGTHLASEEYPPEARGVSTATSWADVRTAGVLSDMKSQARYQGIDVTDANGDGLPDSDYALFRAAYSPYFHGFPVEIALADDGTPAVSKHYAMGRMAIELSYVMPDRKTAFLTDDGTNVGLFMFVADRAGDLSAGRLFAMKYWQTTAPGSAELAGDLEWIDLGHATDAQVRALIHPANGQRITFAEIFDAETPNTDGTCPTAGFKITRGAAATTLECLRLKPGMELAASRLETRRYASLLGATTEMNKEEGITFDPDHQRLYVALTALEKGTNTQPVLDDIHVADNKCGGVFGLDVGPLVDASGNVVTEYAALNWYPMVMGTPKSYPAGSQYAGNSCSVGGLSSPDNVTYLPGYDLLVIGEDTSNHQNDAMWAYNVVTRKLTRIFTTPYGSETTSPYWFPNVNGWGYLMGVVQHPYGESDQARAADAEATGTASWMGVIGPFPALN